MQYVPGQVTQCARAVYAWLGDSGANTPTTLIDQDFYLGYWPEVSNLADELNSFLDWMLRNMVMCIVAHYTWLSLH